MSADKAHLCAPHGKCKCGLEYFRQLVVKGGFINRYVTLHTTQVRRLRAQRLYFKTTGKMNNEGKNFFAFLAVINEQLFFNVTCSFIKGLCPHGCGINELARHFLIRAHIEVIGTVCAFGSTGGKHSV